MTFFAHFTARFLRHGVASFVTLLAVGVSVQAAAYESVDAFVASTKELKPAASQHRLASLFTVPELGQPDDPRTGQPVAATAVESSAALWADEINALVFVCAVPPTEVTRSMIGVLFLLHHDKGSWHIADHRKFVATGKYADVTAELSAGAGTGYHLASDSMPPVVTVKESQGGQGYAYQISASYTFRQSKLRRYPLK